MASRRQRAKRAQAKREAIQAERKAAYIAHERGKRVKQNLAMDNREVAIVRDHLQRPKLVRTTAYSKITDSFIRMIQGGGLRECANLDRLDGDTDRELQAFLERNPQARKR
jgi:hypothetical protein